MKVIALCSINSGKYDKGDVIDNLSEQEAKQLIKSGSARLTIAPDLVQKAKEVVRKATSPTTKKKTKQGR